MPRRPNPIPDTQPDKLVKVTLSLTLGTLRDLDDYMSEHPDLQSRSAAVRKLAREWRRITSRQKGA